MSQRLTDMLTLSVVPRWSIVGHTRPQTVADHTFRVMAIMLELAMETKTPLSFGGLVYAMLHDAPESRTGDIPTPGKEVIGSLEDYTKQLLPWWPDSSPVTPDERDLLRLADLIEAYTYILKWGVGPRAVRVAKSLELKIEDECPPTWLGAVRAMMVDILREEGR